MKRILTLIATLLLAVGSAFAQSPAYTQGASYASIANASATGTTINTLAKLTGVPSTAVIAATTDNKNGSVIGLVVSGAGTTGSATISTAGMGPCVFDGATTAGDFVTVSTTVAGNCKDFGATPPSDGSQVLGRVLSTNASAGTYNIFLNPSLASFGVWNGSNIPAASTGGGVMSTGAITPVASAASIGVNTQTFTLTGLLTTDSLSVASAPAPTALCPLVGARVSAANTVALDFAVLTAVACTPAAGTYKFFVAR